MSGYINGWKKKYFVQGNTTRVLKYLLEISASRLIWGVPVIYYLIYSGIYLSPQSRFIWVIFSQLHIIDRFTFKIAYTCIILLIRGRLD